MNGKEAIRRLSWVTVDYRMSIFKISVGTKKSDADASEDRFPFLIFIYLRSSKSSPTLYMGSFHCENITKEYKKYKH